MKKNIFAIMLITFSCLFLASCSFTHTATQPTMAPYNENFCTKLYIVSNCKHCSGNIIINDRNTGIYLQPWGGTFVTVTSPEIHCGDVVRVNLLNESDVLSHTEARTAIAPQTIIQFDWFK